MRDHLREQLRQLDESGLRKDIRVIKGPQQPHVSVETADGPREILNLCANNYLGLANHPEVVAAARDGLDQWGYGLASVRFVCGTQEIHRDLERAISEFLGTEDTILYSSCFDANGGLFETILGETDAVISDALNHASIIDGIRLCKARRLRYASRDMADLERCLVESASARFRLIATDGVFSMDGAVAPLMEICDLADTHRAVVMVDDSHGAGVIGATGRGSPEYRGVVDRIDVVTGTLGKALGGASGGYTSGRSEFIEILRERSRPYVFSNSVPPSTVTASLKVLELLSNSTGLRDRVHENTRHFRGLMADRGFDIIPGEHPIVPILLGDALVAHRMAARLLEKGVYVIGFGFPIVPKGQARIRVQMSAAHTRADLEFAARMFTEVREELGL
jgi:glycine C-acetyltransferase